MGFLVTRRACELQPQLMARSMQKPKVTNCAVTPAWRSFSLRTPGHGDVRGSFGGSLGSFGGLSDLRVSFGCPSGVCLRSFGNRSGVIRKFFKSLFESFIKLLRSFFRNKRKVLREKSNFVIKIRCYPSLFTDNCGAVIDSRRYAEYTRAVSRSFLNHCLIVLTICILTG